MSANVQLAIFCTPEHLPTMVLGGDVENREAPFDIEQVLPPVRLAYFAPSCTPSCNANTSKRIKRRFSEILSLFVPSIVSLKVFGSAEDTSGVKSSMLTAQCLLNERFFVLASFFIRKEVDSSLSFDVHQAEVFDRGSVICDVICSVTKCIRGLHLLKLWGPRGLSRVT